MGATDVLLQICKNRAEAAERDFCLRSKLRSNFFSHTALGSHANDIHRDCILVSAELKERQLVT